MMVKFTQSIDDFGDVEAIKKTIAQLKKNAAFDEWRQKLNPTDTLPQGKYFRGKKPGKTRMIIDEAHLLRVG